MIVDAINQELAIVATVEQEQFVAMQDLELMFVGGGGASAVLF